MISCHDLPVFGGAILWFEFYSVFHILIIGRHPAGGEVRFELFLNFRCWNACFC